MTRQPEAEAVLAFSLALALGCSSVGTTGAHNEPSTAVSTSRRADTTALEQLPAGYGSLRQDDIAVKIQLPALLVRAIPLDESILRVLSPDSYRALRDLREGKRAEIERVSSRQGERNPSLWYVSFYGLQPDTPFSPQEVVIASGGRDYRPLDVLPLSAGFGQQRVGQREVQSAIYLFDDGVDPNQPLTVSVQGAQSASWRAQLPVIERERAVIRSRAGKEP
jgi:hypothetical protein